MEVRKATVPLLVTCAASSDARVYDTSQCYRLRSLPTLILLMALHTPVTDADL